MDHINLDFEREVQQIRHSQILTSRIIFPTEKYISMRFHGVSYCIFGEPFWLTTHTCKNLVTPTMFTTAQMAKQRNNRREIVVLHEHSSNRSTILVPYLVTNRQCVGILRNARGLSFAPPWKEEIRRLGILVRLHSSWMQLVTWRTKKGTKYWLCQNPDDQSPCWLDDMTDSCYICICICMRSALHSSWMQLAT